MIRRTLARLAPLMNSRGSVARNAGIVAVAYAISRVLGMMREIVIATRFGTGETYDAYVAAFRIPDLLFVVVMSGAFGSAFIPVFGGYLARGEAEVAWRLANALLTWTVVILLVLAQMVFLVARPLVASVIAPNLAAGAQDLAVDLTRILLLSPLLLGLGAAAKGMLEAQDAFTLPAVAPIIYNLGIILGAVLVAPTWGIHGLAWGVVGGAAGHAGIQFAGLLRQGWRPRAVLSRTTPGLRDVARLAVPRLAGQAVGQSNLIVVTNIASGAGPGAISALFYGQHLVLLPHGILAMSLATVIFPRMSRQFGRGEHEAVRRTMMAALLPLTFLTLPAAIILLALRESIVHVVYQYGSFGSESAALVGSALAWLAPGLLARSLIEPLTRGFYAMHDTTTPLYVAAGAVALNAALAMALAPEFGLAGIAASLTVTYSLRMLGLLALLSRRSGGLTRDWLAGLWRMVPAVAVTLGLALAAGPLLSRVTDPSGGRDLWGYVVFAVALLALGLTYTLVSTFSGVPEARSLIDRIPGRTRRS